MPIPARRLPMPGNLEIVVRNGRRGPFKVGVLRTPMYAFAVKDVALEQFDAGAYDGEFVIDRIYVHFYPTSSGGGFEIRAVLAEMRLFEFEQPDENADEQSAPLEPDPADEERDEDENQEQFSVRSKRSRSRKSDRDQQPPINDVRPEQSATAVQPKEVSSAEPPAQDSDSDDRNDRDLFGTLWPLSPRMKLDPTVGRLRFRSQCSRLAGLGFKPDHRTQEWYREAA